MPAVKIAQQGRKIHFKRLKKFEMETYLVKSLGLINFARCRQVEMQQHCAAFFAFYDVIMATFSLLYFSSIFNVMHFERVIGALKKCSKKSGCPKSFLKISFCSEKKSSKFVENDSSHLFAKWTFPFFVIPEAVFNSK